MEVFFILWITCFISDVRVTATIHNVTTLNQYICTHDYCWTFIHRVIDGTGRTDYIRLVIDEMCMEPSLFLRQSTYFVEIITQFISRHTGGPIVTMPLQTAVFNTCISYRWAYCHDAIADCSVQHMYIIHEYNVNFS